MVKKKIKGRLSKVARRAIKPIAKASAVVKKKTSKSTKAALGIGKRVREPREATKSDIKRAGATALRRSNKALARFIAARYSAKAIAKYNDYAGRLRRSRRLIKQIVEIDANTFRIRQYIIKTDTAGNNPYSCTCPDFSQFSDDDRNWLGSKAGPFNPCKHMMAVRDRKRGGKWVCNDGVCTLDPNATNGFATKAECEAKIIRAAFTGGQCAGVKYGFDINWKIISSEDRPELSISKGQLLSTGRRIYDCIFGGLDNTTGTEVLIYGPIGNPFVINPPSVTVRQIRFVCQNSAGETVTIAITAGNPLPFALNTEITEIKATVTRCDRLPDNCGNLKDSCPT